MDEQTEHLERVSARIGTAIVEFIQQHPHFHADDLRRYVHGCVGSVAPGSPDRILRHLRKNGVIDYVVTSRRESSYHARLVPKQTEMSLAP